MAHCLVGVCTKPSPPSISVFDDDGIKQLEIRVMFEEERKNIAYTILSHFTEKELSRIIFVDDVAKIVEDNLRESSKNGMSIFDGNLVKRLLSKKYRRDLNG